jgi:alkane 1-monooxygenase
MLFLLFNIGATGFVVAHELFHRSDPIDKFIGTAHMLKNLYLHLTIEHIHGHHKRVATP